MGLDEDAGVLLVRIADFFACSYGFGKAVSSEKEAAMRLQWAQTPQKSGRLSVGWARQLVV